VSRHTQILINLKIAGKYLVDMDMPTHAQPELNAALDN